MARGLSGPLSLHLVKKRWSPVPFCTALCYLDPHFSFSGVSSMSEKIYDVLIIGGGPAGLTAGL
jgi:NADPH-dependent 2,4-dienoyl-CoA reductase/sulfur reductase-like enzyme